MEYTFNEKLYNTYKKRAENKNLPFEITKNEFTHMINSNCYYCDAPPRQCSDSIRNGIDRINNEVGYITGNSVTCCTTCNMIKRNIRHDDFLRHIEKIYFDNENYKKLTPREVVLFMIKRGRIATPSYIHQYIQQGYILASDIKYDYFADVVENKSELDFLKRSLKKMVKLAKLPIYDYENKIDNMKDQQYIDIYREMLETNYVNARRLLKYLGADYKKFPKDLKYMVEFPKAPGLGF